VSTEARDGRVQLSVTDNGSGFAEHLISRAFEPYVTTKPGGTGLGLVIVKKIIEEHGGEVAIRNVMPRGAQLTVSLPAATAAARVASESGAQLKV
jgi:nitrogen fixation/metabolism regulation signal transduction histidine kinase